jgi:type IV secretion system protein VirB10
MQGQGRTILDGPVDRRTASVERLSAPPSPYVIQAGTVIPAALITGVRADLPGQVVAQVTENVFDSPTGRFLLIPQGSRLIGAYDSRISAGQTRVLLAWTRLILPGGDSMVLENQPAGDGQGYAGLQDGVDRHWRELFGMATLSTLLGVGAELGAGQEESDIVRALRRGATGALSQVGQQAVGQALDLAPTLTVRPGLSVRVIVTRDLVLRPLR